ncbi:hypothetical protein BGZ46_002660 [Entomortierella lignicola]|nr:hypothetical protein BGZ46_002660 [Entomortierella lignicola]
MRNPKTPQTFQNSCQSSEFNVNSLISHHRDCIDVDNDDGDNAHEDTRNVQSDSSQASLRPSDENNNQKQNSHELDATEFARLLSHSTLNTTEYHGNSKRAFSSNHSPYLGQIDSSNADERLNTNHNNQHQTLRVTRSLTAKKISTIQTSVEPNRQVRRLNGSRRLAVTPNIQKKNQSNHHSTECPQQQQPQQQQQDEISVLGQLSDLNLNSSNPKTSIGKQFLSEDLIHPQASTAISSCVKANTISTNFEPSLYFPLSASALHQKRRKAKRHAIRVPRPKNCFMLYRSKVLPMIMAELGSINNKIISKIAAERWRAEIEPVKAWYRQMAKQGKEEHARNNPGYRYAPHKKLMAAAAAAARSNNTRNGTGNSVGCEDSGEEDEDDDLYESEVEDSASLNEEIVDEDNSMENHGRNIRWGLTSKKSNTVSIKTGKRVRTGESDLYPHPQVSVQVDEDEITKVGRRGRPRSSKKTKIRKGDQDESISRRKSNSSSINSSFEGSSTDGVNGGYMDRPAVSTAYSIAAPTSLLGCSLIEQQLYLSMQQRQDDDIRILQQQYQQHLQLQYHQQQNLHHQQQQLSEVSQAHPLHPISLTGSQAPGPYSLYSIPLDGNTSTSTLVDPVSHWMTHHYHGDASFFDYSNNQPPMYTFGQSYSKPGLPFYDTEKTATSQDKLMTTVTIDKDLPLLPHESMALSQSTSPPWDDPNSILSQLFAQYNSNISWEQTTSFMQEIPIQLFTAAKEPDPKSATWTMSLTGNTAIEQHESISQDHQQLQLEQLQQPQQQHQQYLIKPACPTSFISFADVGQGSMSLMDDLFTWLNDSRDNNSGSASES